MFSCDYSFKGLVTELPHIDPQCSWAWFIPVLAKWDGWRKGWPRAMAHRGQVESQGEVYSLLYSTCWLSIC